MPVSYSTNCADTRLRVVGKALYAGPSRFWARGVTYGTFRAESDVEYQRDKVAWDFARMEENGLNAVRTYTVPPRWLLDMAQKHGLRVLVGHPWEQHMAFLDDRSLSRRIEAGVARGVRACAGHPAVLAHAIGNEIPTSIVRWHGHARIERFLRGLFDIAKNEDPAALCTYVNYPSTEYLDLSFLDFLSFNVYLESQERYEAYLSRLQNLAGDRPLLLGEVGLDSRSQGEESQATMLGWQIRTAHAAGCAGTFIFAWTDEWHRGGFDIDDWDFGLTRRNREPKPALKAVRENFARELFGDDRRWPRISVVVCSYNGSRTIADCCEGLIELLYPDFEVIVVDDGSTDNTAEIAARFGFKLIVTENRGLSDARNTGLAAATGEIVAYIDDDARPDTHWLYYLALTFMSTRHVGVGGPNIAPVGTGSIADCVANAPGGPMHVLIADTEAEHIPGCNMAFRRSALQQVGGFDPQFRTAGDDVDVCWRLQERGWSLGFNPGAFVLHRRRNSIRTFWRQQIGYGKAEALLERKWPEKYNDFGHLTWSGRLYGQGGVYNNGVLRFFLGGRERIYHGTWGSAHFQSLHESVPGVFGHLLQMPEWFLVLGLLSALTILGLLWSPFLAAGPVLLIGLIATISQASMNAARAIFPGPKRSNLEMLSLRAVTAMLHLVQPIARLVGRLRHGLTPWRRRGASGFLPPWHTTTSWSEVWESIAARVQRVETWIRSEGMSVLRGGPYDRWDLEVRCGLLGGSRGLFVAEEHRKQLVRLRTFPVLSAPAIILGSLLLVLSLAAALDSASIASLVLGAALLLFMVRLTWECGVCSAALHQALRQHENPAPGRIDGEYSEPLATLTPEPGAASTAEARSTADTFL